MEIMNTYFRIKYLILVLKDLLVIIQVPVRFPVDHPPLLLLDLLHADRSHGGFGPVDLSSEQSNLLLKKKYVSQLTDTRPFPWV